MKNLPHCCCHTSQSPLAGITVLVQVTVVVAAAVMADAVRWAAMKKAVTGTNINGMNL